jgi:MYXO-CTERM domain-containing protein
LCPNGKSDCKADQNCKDGICRDPIGTPCTVVDQASSFAPECEFMCKQPMGVQETICTNTCNSGRPCPTGNICGADNLCAPGSEPPMLKMVGEACLDGSECTTMLCQGTCLALCDDANPCADGTMCAAVTGGMGCVPAMPKAASGGCDVAPGPAGIPLFLLVFLAFVRRRRLTV